MLRLYRPGNTSVHVDGITGATTLLSSREADSTLAAAREAHSSFIAAAGADFISLMGPMGPNTDWGGL